MLHACMVLTTSLTWDEANIALTEIQKDSLMYVVVLIRTDVPGRLTSPRHPTFATTPRTTLSSVLESPPRLT